jgi:cobyrinic acid a,c-diamide synthase
MPPPARLAIGTVQPQANRFPVLWGLLNLWRRHGLQVQPFRAHAELSSSPGAEVAAGRPYRHIDTGMLFPRLCDHLLFEGAKGCDLAVVDGEFCTTPHHRTEGQHYFDSLCESLDFAAVVVVDVKRLMHGHLPPRPQRLDGVLLDAVPNSAEAIRWSLEIEALWRVPVLGWMPEIPALRAIAEGLPASLRPSEQLCHELGNALLPHCSDDAICEIAHRNHPKHGENAPWLQSVGSVTIAVGIDEAMSRHFPENLELLAARGAKLIDFSPLRSTELPRGTEVVYLADGCLHQFAESISKRSCLFAALQAHVAAGGWIYAEGLGAAMLGSEVWLAPGHRVSMAGVLPWGYRLQEVSPTRELQEICTEQDNWLTHGCSRLRGYAGCARLEALPSSENASHAQVQAWRSVVASTLPLFFPAHPRLVQNMLHVNARSISTAVH